MMSKYQQNSGAGKETMKKRRRLLQIGVMVSMCLLLNVIATLATSAKLEEWSQTADVLLTCSIKETQISRNWGAYGFTEDKVVNVCSREETNDLQSAGASSGCASACFWHPWLYDGGSLFCAPEGLEFDSFERYAAQVLSNPEWGQTVIKTCDCPCDTLIQVLGPALAAWHIHSEVT
jgi:hypothetical protein